MVTDAIFPSGDVLPQSGREEVSEAAGETTSGKDQEVRWKVAAIAQGLAEAAIIRGRLEAEGIPALVRQEPAGAAIGLTVGALGEVKVMVPEDFIESALAILNQPAQGPDDYDE